MTRLDIWKALLALTPPLPGSGMVVKYAEPDKLKLTITPPRKGGTT
jgi:hypothetical protein